MLSSKTNVSDECITRQEIKAALKNVKNGKATGMDTIMTELLKADTETTACALQDLFRTVWEVEVIPENWNCGLIVKLPKKGNFTECENWRGIMLLSVPWLILNCMSKDELRSAISVPNSPFHKRPEILCRKTTALHSLEQ